MKLKLIFITCLLVFSLRSVSENRYFLDNFGIGISSSLSKGFLDRRELSTGVCLSFQINKIYFDFFSTGESFLYEKPNNNPGGGRFLHTGPRGGVFYINSSGNKTYVTGYSSRYYDVSSNFFSLDYSIVEFNFGYLFRFNKVGITPLVGIHLRGVRMDNSTSIETQKKWALRYSNTTLEELYKIDLKDVSKTSPNLGLLLSYYSKNNYKFDLKFTVRSVGFSIGLPFKI